MAKVVYVDAYLLHFDDDSRLYSNHDSDCCEQHWLDFSQHTLSDFEGLDFDLSSDSFFEKVEDYGIRLVPVSGHPIGVPGYGRNNGYYSANLTLVLERPAGLVYFDITECQEIN